MNPAEVIMKKQQERDTLRNVVAQWNANRLDLFELSEPNEDLEFHGVMRFYFQDSGQKVATKCIRVASDATSQAVIETLIEKFRPDMRMLSVPEYALYEIHENGDERRLGVDEKPLLVQLNWHIDDREGRFLLRRIDDVTNMPSVSFQEGGSSFRRKLSKREKKQLKKQEKLNKLKTTAVPDENDAGVAEKLYTELPETSFTRSISNPEAVMRRRRQQKLERKLQQFRSKDGGPDTGGTLKIYGEALCRDVPYKTLLLSVRDSAQQVVREMLAKYGLEKEQDPHSFCLVQVNTAIPVENGESKEYHGGTTNREYILDDDECPLAILMNHPSSRGSIMFHVRRRPADYHPRKRKKKLQGKWSKGSDLQEYRYEDSTGYNNLPFFLELNPDGSDILNGAPKRHRLHPNVTEVGSERPNSQSQATQQQQNQPRSLQLFGPNIQPRHCVVGHTAGIVTVTPCSREAETYVNSQRVYETTILQNGAVVKFGRIHVFRFLDPNHDPDRTRQRHDSARQNLDFSYDRQSSRGDNEASGQQPSPNASTQNYETTFDVDGNVETVSTSSLKEETRSQRSVSSSNGNRLSNYERYPRGTDPILPAVLEFREETEEAFLHAIITDLDPSAPSFKLAPAYCLYLVARYRASTHYRPELTPTERAHRLTGLLARVAAIVHNVIQERYTDAKLLAFWMANSSELLHFLKCDRHISAFSLDAQDILAECVEISFRNLVSCLQGDLAAVMPHFMAKEDQTEEQQDSTGSVLQVLTLAMALLRRCRVNAALTIQLFSQLFHFINMWAFNKVVTSTSPSVCYCTRAWGLRLKTKLAQLEVWAERQGLELAADCHLARIIQAAHLLQAPKYSPEDLATLSSTCFKLNSLQLRALLSKYQPTSEEPRLPHELIENVVRVAENVADELARSDGREIRLEEETELQLPFLLPEDGYSCDVVRGVPQGLAEFLAPLQHAGLCRMSGQPTSSGLWTIYMHQAQTAGARSPSAMSNRSGGFPPGHLQEPELQVIRLNKSNNGMGLSIVAAKGAGQDRLGIYIKSVVKGGAADADGQLQAGDQLLKVDGQSLVGITQERAAEYLVRTGPTVTLEVAKQGAIYHGLATLLQQPSPVMARASPAARTRPKSELLQPPQSSLPSSLSLSNLRQSQRQSPPPTFEERLVDWDTQPGPRRMSERDLPSRVLSEQNHNGDSRRSLNTHAPIQSSKSVPALNSGNNDLVHGGPMTSTPATHPLAAKHEVFNPGYSRTSSTNSIPQQAGLRSKSSQNLSDPRAANPQLPPTGLGSRQSSNPSLHHPQYPPTHSHPGHTGGQVGSGQQPNGEGERFYQNLSIYRNQEIHNGYPPPSPNRGKLPSPQGHEDRSPATTQGKGLRGSQSSLHNPANAPSLRPASAYLPPSNSPAGYNGPQQMAARSQSTRDIGQESPQGYSPQQMSARSQSSRDVMRQEAKLHEMQEEVRRREMRGVISPQQYPVQPGPPPHTRPQMPAHLQQRVPNTTYPYSQDSNHPFSGPTPQYNGQRPPLAYAPPTAPKPVRHPSEPALNRPPNAYEQYRPQHGDLRHPPSEQYRPQMGPLPHTQNEQYRPHLVQQQELLRAQAENRVGFSPQYATDGPNRPQMAHEEAGYRDSPPPPPPPTATHPLYQQKPAPLTGPQPDVRYSASSGEAPRGGFYPASPSSSGPPRQPFPFNSVATSPWEREEREKDQQRRREAARAWRDQQINELSSLAQRTAQQEEQLRALRLEREFQRRAEEAAKLEEEEEGEEEQESVERVQGLLRMATATQNTPPKHPHILQNGRPNQPLSQPPRPPVVEDKERMRKVEEMRREQELKREHEMRRDQEIKREQEANKRREEEIRHHQQQLQQQQLQQQQQQQQLQQQQQQQQLQQQQQQQMLQQQQLIQQQQQQQQQLKENFMASTQQNQLRQPNNINSQFPTKPTNPSHLRLDNLVINGPSSPTTQYNGYNGSYQPEHKTLHGEGILKSPPQSPTESGAARLDSLLGVGDRISQAPLPPERGSSFAITQAVTQGVLRGGRETSGVGTATVKRVSFSDPNANNQTLSPGGGQPMERIREDPNHFINEAETLLASPKSPDGSPFANNTPGVIGSQEVYKDPRARLLAAQQKLQLTRSGPLPEKLSFKEKMKMFAMETGEDGTPRDKVKISRAQRDIDNLAGSPTSPLSPNNNQ